MQRLYGFPALVAALTILANSFIQEPLISASAINFSFNLTYTNPKKIGETSKKTSFASGEKKSFQTFSKDETKKITTISNQISVMGIADRKVLPHNKLKPPEASSTEFDPNTIPKSSEPSIEGSPKNYIKSEFITKVHELPTQQEINNATPPRISHLPSSLEANYANEYLTSSRIKFPEVVRPSSKVHDKFNNLTLFHSSEGKNDLDIVSVITNGSSEVYKNMSDYRDSEISGLNRFSKADHNRDFPQDVLSSGFNQLRGDQSSFTIKEFPQGSSPSFVTTDSKIPNSGETTVNSALSKQPVGGEISPSFAINVNGNSEISRPKMVNKDSSIGQVANLIPGGNKLADKLHEVSETPNEIGLTTSSKNLLHKVDDSNLKSKIFLQSSVVSSLLKSEQKSSGNRLCERVGSSCFNQEAETREEKGINNISPTSFPVNLELVSREIGEHNFPQKLKKSIKRELCKVSSMCPQKQENSQLEKRRNSDNPVRNGKEKGKSVIPLKYATIESKRDLNFVVDESKVENFTNKAIQNGSLNSASSSKLEISRVRVKEKLRGNKKDVDSLNDSSGIISGSPYRFTSAGQLNYPSRKLKYNVLKSLQNSDYNTSHLLKDQLEFSSSVTYKENTNLPDRYFQLNRNKGRRSPGIVFTNSSNDHLIQKEKGAFDRNFIVGQIRNYALDKESNLKNGTMKESSQENSGGLDRSGKIGDFNSFGRNESGIGKINEGLITNAELSGIKSLKNNKSSNIRGGLKINETLRIHQTGDFNFTLTGDEGSGENSTKVSTPVNQWPVKHSVVMEGDIVLGGLMMVHEREDTITCGPVMPQGGIQALEAMLYTLDRLNGEEIVPGVKIGAHILDDCDKDTYGLEMAVDFIKGL